MPDVEKGHLYPSRLRTRGIEVSKTLFYERKREHNSCENIEF